MLHAWAQHDDLTQEDDEMDTGGSSSSSDASMSSNEEHETIDIDSSELSSEDSSSDSDGESDSTSDAGEPFQRQGRRSTHSARGRYTDFSNARQRPSTSLDENVIITHDRYPPLDYIGPKLGFQINERMTTVQLDDGDLLRVQHVVEYPSKDHHGQTSYFLRGWTFADLAKSRGKLTKHYGNNNYEEVMMQLDISQHDGKTDLQSGIRDIDISKIVRNVELVITNTMPATPLNFAHNLDKFVCRWTSRKYFKDEVSRSKGEKFAQMSLARVRFAEADKDYRIEDWKLTKAYLGFLPNGKARYTFGDACCGAGGASSAARRARYHVKFGFDWARRATMTYGANNQDTEVFTASVEQMLAVFAADMDRYHVDVLHISPPCQPYSGINVRPNAEKDAMNQATMLAVGEMIRCVRPRVVTIEQTSGILSIKKHKVWFRKLINLMTEEQYSVRWRISLLNANGNVQTRRRLTIYGALPGGVLPDFPPPTHGDPSIDHRLKPYTTIRQILAPLENTPLGSDPYHDVEKARLTVPQRPYSADTPLKHLITTTGTTSYHPSGLRKFTPRETLALAGFPWDYKIPHGMPASKVVEQAGNAVPGEAFAPYLFQAALSLEYEDVERSTISFALDQKRMEERLAAVKLSGGMRLPGLE